MKFDDSDKDYFLHDFSKDNVSDGGMADTVGQKVMDNSTDTGTKSPAFDFGDTDGQDAEDMPVKPRRRGKRILIWFFIIIICALGLTVWIRYFVPYVTESQSTGFVTLVEKRGIVFHTFEGEMVSESQLADTQRVYSRDVYFSIPDDNLARRLQQYQGSGTPVRLTFKRYYGTLPWRGASNNILVSFTPVQ